MKKRVDFLLESNVMTGGVKLNNNFLISTDYISGAVVRAGFANDILFDCKHYDEIYDGRKHIVAYRGSECEGCSNVNICKNFSDMYFSFLFPKDTAYAPLTMKTCKAYGTEHLVQDIIFNNNSIKCSKCSDGIGRMENMKGLINVKSLKEYKVKRNISTHTAINYATRTAKDGSLFQIDAIKRGEIFSGIIDDKDSGLLEVGKIIYIGKYSSSGFGKIKIHGISDYQAEDIEDRIDKFNNKKDKISIDKDKIDKDKLFSSILFRSDAKIFDKQQLSDKSLTTEEYKEIWKKAIFGDNDIIHIEKVFAQNFLYSGYDTSIDTSGDNENWQKDSEVHTQMGTSVLISFDLSQRGRAIELLKGIEENGVGNDTNAGYGQVEVCSKLHMIGVDDNDKKRFD